MSAGQEKARGLAFRTPRALRLGYVRNGSSTEVRNGVLDVDFTPDCVAKRFCAPKPATLIQDQVSTRNIDSKKCSCRFDYYQVAASRRVLQQYPLTSGHHPTDGNGGL